MGELHAFGAVHGHHCHLVAGWLGGVFGLDGVDAVVSKAGDDAAELAAGTAHHADARVLDLGRVLPFGDVVGGGVELLVGGVAERELRVRAGAGRAVAEGGVQLAIGVGELPCPIEDAQGVVQVLFGGAVVQREFARGAAASGDAEAAQRQGLAVDALVGVFGEEDVIGIVASDAPDFCVDSRQTRWAKRLKSIAWVCIADFLSIHTSSY